MGRGETNRNLLLGGGKGQKLTRRKPVDYKFPKDFENNSNMFWENVFPLIERSEAGIFSQKAFLKAFDVGGDFNFATDHNDYKGIHMRWRFLQQVYKHDLNRNYKQLMVDSFKYLYRISEEWNNRFYNMLNAEDILQIKGNIVFIYPQNYSGTTHILAKNTKGTPLCGSDLGRGFSKISLFKKKVRGTALTAICRECKTMLIANPEQAKEAQESALLTENIMRQTAEKIYENHPDDLIPAIKKGMQEQMIYVLLADEKTRKVWRQSVDSDMDDFSDLRIEAPVVDVTGLITRTQASY